MEPGAYMILVDGDWYVNCVPHTVESRLEWSDIIDGVKDWRAEHGS